MVRLNNKTLLGVFVSFVIILALIAIVRSVFPGVLMDGFANMSCYGVNCKEGEFCQESVCRAINPPYTNDYYNKGAESFADMSGSEPFWAWYSRPRRGRFADMSGNK